MATTWECFVMFSWLVFNAKRRRNHGAFREERRSAKRTKYRNHLAHRQPKQESWGRSRGTSEREAEGNTATVCPNVFVIRSLHPRHLRHVPRHDDHQSVDEDDDDADCDADDDDDDMMIIRVLMKMMMMMMMMMMTRTVALLMTTTMSVMMMMMVLMMSLMMMRMMMMIMIMMVLMMMTTMMMMMMMMTLMMRRLTMMMMTMTTMMMMMMMVMMMMIMMMMVSKSQGGAREERTSGKQQGIQKPCALMPSISVPVVPATCDTWRNAAASMRRQACATTDKRASRKPLYLNEGTAHTMAQLSDGAQVLDDAQFFDDGATIRQGLSADHGGHLLTQNAKKECRSADNWTPAAGRRTGKSWRREGRPQTRGATAEQQRRWRRSPKERSA
ncbi:hypothetical protein CBR_g20041 [Chara braunii]|uniref:Uncharacterized protein n=1 Tax=Chara braunii TaxID=69332 RepID=A0A388KZF4_CHABU|nr:hypothetical protein CBR_g20041 [Chara braunii]|eukprot:GBG75411.1 hypothetical protein CBR_g20041 [Chara braunii]